MLLLVINYNKQEKVIIKCFVSFFCPAGGSGEPVPPINQQKKKKEQRKRRKQQQSFVIYFFILNL